MSSTNKKNKEKLNEICNLIANYIKNDENSQNTDILIKTLYESNICLTDQSDYEQLKMKLINVLLNDYFS